MTGSPRSLSWDVVRVLAVASVVVQHATYTVSAVMPFLTAPPVVWSVEAGANTLMVVSAYFVCVTLARREPLRWWWGRIARLMPAYLVAVVVTYLATRVAAGHGYWDPTPRDLWGNLLLLHPWDPSIVLMDGGYWTLPLQIGVFSLAATAVAVLGRRVWRHPAALPALAWAGVLLPVVLDVLATGWLRTVYDGLTVFRWQLFAVGLAVWLTRRGTLSVTHLAGLGAVAVLAEYAITPDALSGAGLAVGGVLVALAALGPDWTLLRVGALPRVVTWLAGISYGIYLMNQQIGYFAAWVLQDTVGLGGWPRLVAVVALAIALGWGLTVVVERPAHRLLTARQRVNDAAAARNRSFSAGAPAETRTPSPANPRTTTLPSSACSTKRLVASPSGSQTKLASEAGTA